MDYPAASIFDPIADAYDGWYDTLEGHSIFKDEVRCLRQLRDDSSGRWLEVGVGTGRFATALGITHGVDLSPQMAAIAKRRGIQVQVGSAMQLPFADSSFDGVLLALTLCFIVGPEQAFRECGRILRDRGQMVIGTVPADSPWGISYIKKKNAGHPIYSHAHFRTAAETIHFAEKEHFKLRTSCSALFGEPDRFQSEQSRIESGIFAEAGFVGLLFESHRSGV
jgi:ubiquinone/menaquinone biosynthesis C-methylase UbiE